MTTKSKWYVSPTPGWKITTNRSDAISHYIGEVVVIPKISHNTIRAILGLPVLESVTLFYYGTPNRELLIRFGYELPKQEGGFVLQFANTYNSGRVYNTTW